MESDHRQGLLNRIEQLVLELFADGLDEANDAVKHMVLHGLSHNRLNISVEILVSPVSLTHHSFAVVSQNGAGRVDLFEIDSTIHKPLVITPLADGSDAVN